jgi:HAD superfamily hydrolase (TIGR01490 family)
MKIVIFDMDKTLVSVDTIGLWAEFLGTKNLLTDSDRQQQREFDLAYREHRLDYMASYEFDLVLLKRIPIQLRAQWQQEFFQLWVKPKISLLGLQLIAEHKQQSNTIVLLATATISYIASPIAAFTGVHHLIATQEEIVDGDYTGKVMGTPSIGPGKLTRFEQWLAEAKITPLHTVFYSDSFNDLPLLDYVKKAIAVDPDQRLREIAVQRNWPIISFHNSNQDNSSLPLNSILVD